MEFEPGYTQAISRDKKVIIRIEELSKNDPSLPTDHQIKNYIQKLESILRITGNFYAGPHHIIATNTEVKVGNRLLQRNVLVGTGGIRLSQDGFAM